MSAPRIDPEQWAEAGRWLARADVDLQIADLILREKTISLQGAALHCQQAAEKMAKAVLIALGIFPPRIHDVDRLGELVAAHLSDIGSSLRELGALTLWYASSRYPDLIEDEPSVEQIDDALKKLHSVRRQIGTLAPGP